MKKEENYEAKRKCLQCGETYKVTRSDKRFCNSTCRSKYSTNAKTKEVQSTHHLKGVVTPGIKKTTSSNAAVSQKQIESINTKKNWYQILLDGCIKSKKEKELELSILTNDGNILIRGTGAVIGGIVGNSISNNPVVVIGASIAGAILATPSHNKTPHDEFAIHYRTITLKNEISNLNRSINDFQNEINSCNLKLLSIKPIISPAKTKQDDSSPIIPTAKNKATQETILKNSCETNDKTKSKNVIGSNELVKIDHSEFDFKGRWLDLIGRPKINFNTAIYGKAGGGKSTFAIQKAYYLAVNFGPVLYISGEEGFSKTFADKFKRLGAATKDLYVADLKSYEEIVAELKKNAYHFIFIDSLDTLSMGPEEMRKLKKMYPNNAYVTISQSTKDGQMRGSNELKHDCDIYIQVVNGKAITEKNRFAKDGQEFEVF